jgi:hypothetical protein
MLSDNFSNFVSKDKELESWVRSFKINDLISTTKAIVRWHFIPSRGPHHGGIHECMAGVSKRVSVSLFFKRRCWKKLDLKKIFFFIPLSFHIQYE